MFHLLTQKKTFVALHRKRTENHGLLSHSK